MPKVALISTEFIDVLPEEYQGSHAAEEPLDLLYVAGSLRDIVETRVINFSDIDDLEFLSESDAIVYSTTNSYLQWNNHPLGLSLFKKTWDRASNYIRIGVPRFVFGPHVPMHYMEILGMGATAVFIGEAELEVANAVTASLQIRGSNARTNSSGPIAVANLDDLPTPAYEHSVRREYAAHNSPHDKYKLGHLYEASRGCPYQCSFCNTITHRREYRTKSASTISRDLERLALLTERRDYIYFIDESFAYRNDWFSTIEPVLTELPFVYGAQGNLAFMSVEKLETLQRAGFVSIEFGLESADRNILKQVGKNNRLPQAASLINSAADLGLNPLLFINVGLPGETGDTLKATTEFLSTLSPKVRMSVAMPTPYKGTALDALGRSSGIIPTNALPQEGYLYTGKIGHDLSFSETDKNKFLAKYGPNNFLESHAIDSFRNDVLGLFGV